MRVHIWASAVNRYTLQYLLLAAVELINGTVKLVILEEVSFTKSVVIVITGRSKHNM